jgi:membrane fusion protein, heavy metal efflux system
VIFVRLHSVLIPFVVAASLGPSSILAQTIRLSEQEASNLGITMVRPQPTEQQTTISTMARVVVPTEVDQAVVNLYAGVVAQLYVAKGDRVNKDQALARLISPQFLTLQSNYLDALGTYQLAAAALDRDNQLHNEGIISARRLRETQTRAAEAELHLKEQQTLLKMSGLTTKALADLEQNRQLLRSMTVHAPVSGEVLDQWVGIGQQVDPGTPLFRVADLTNLWLELQVPHTALSRLNPGNHVTLPNASEKSALARIEVITSAVDPGTQKVYVRAATVRADHNLLPGQRLEVAIHIPAPAAADRKLWQVPARAITRMGTQSFLFTRSEQGFQAVPARIAGDNGELVYVEADINSNSAIALSGTATLKAIWLSAQDSE